MTVHSGNSLGTLLAAAGLVPKLARKVELHVPVDGALMLRYEVFLDTNDLRIIAAALQTLAGTDDGPKERQE